MSCRYSYFFKYTGKEKNSQNYQQKQKIFSVKGSKVLNNWASAPPVF